MIKDMTNSKLISSYLFWIYVGITFASIFQDSILNYFISLGVTCFFYVYAIEDNKFIMLQEGKK